MVRFKNKKLVLQYVKKQHKTYKGQMIKPSKLLKPNQSKRIIRNREKHSKKIVLNTYNRHNIYCSQLGGFKSQNRIWLRQQWPKSIPIAISKSRLSINSRLIALQYNYNRNLLFRSSRSRRSKRSSGSSRSNLSNFYEIS